jgi:hypothetical protein
MKLFEIGRFACGQTAELSGYSKGASREMLGKYGGAVVDYSPWRA